MTNPPGPSDRPSRLSKGSILLIANRHADRVWGPGGWQRVLARMADDDREIAQGALAFSWIPSQTVGEAYAALAREMEASGASSLRDFGLFAAEQDLTVLHRLFFKMANPAYVLEKSMQYWRRFHSWGSWSVQREPRDVVATLQGFHIGPAYCAFLTVYLGRLMELVGARDVVVRKTSCVHSGAPACAYRGSFR